MNTVVIGTTFVGIKGFPNGKYEPLGRNLGDIRTVHGGVGRNVAENIANIGMPVSYCGMLEDTAFGRDVERHLRSIGVGLEHMIMAPENGIGMWMLILDEMGNQAGSISKMPDIGYLEEYIRGHGEEIVLAADSIVLEIDLNETIAELVISWAERHHKPVYSIVGNMSVVMARKDLIRKTRCFICNEMEAARFFSCPANRLTAEESVSFLPEAAEREGLQSMVVTLGEHGAVFYDGRTKAAGFCPPYPTDVVDTSGAGDAFFTGTVMALTKKIPLPEAVKYGAKLASNTISWDQTVCPVNRKFLEPDPDEGGSHEG